MKTKIVVFFAFLFFSRTIFCSNPRSDIAEKKVTEAQQEINQNNFLNELSKINFGATIPQTKLTELVGMFETQKNELIKEYGIKMVSCVFQEKLESLVGYQDTFI